MEGHIKIPLPEVSLLEAANAVEDASYWDRTMPAVLYFYKITVADYWSLTVYQHRLLWDWLVEGGMVKNADEET
jgi:hypothetical protein